MLPRGVVTPGAPALLVEPAGPGLAKISWATKAPGYVLQETASLTPPAWFASPSGATNPGTVPTAGEMKYYRLFKPRSAPRAGSRWSWVPVAGSTAARGSAWAAPHSWWGTGGKRARPV